MLTIHLKDLIFNASHGLHAGEEMIGNRFNVSMDIELNIEGSVESLEQTVDYARAYEIIRKHMMHRSDLLETPAQLITDEIFSIYPAVNRTKITIMKLNVPVPQLEGATGISFERRR